MNVDDVLRASVERITLSIEPPMPDPVGIRRRARQKRQQRAFVGLTAAAAVVASVGAGFWYVGDQGDGPTPAAPSPTRESSGVPGQVSPAGAVWYAEGVLHDDQKSFRIKAELATNLAVVAHGVLYGDDSGKVIYQGQDGSTAIIGEGARLGPVGDPSSDVAVWFEKTAGVAELVVYDVAKDKELARADLGAINIETPDGMVGRKQPPVLWVGDGQSGEAAVYFRVEGSVWRYDWTSGENPQRLKGEFSDALHVGGDVRALIDPNHRGMIFKSSDGTELSTYAPVEPDGSLSHDGRYYVGYTPDGTVVIETSTGDARPLNLDAYQLVMGLTWARDDTVVMLAPNVSGEGSVLACDVTSLQCQTGEQVDNFALIVLPTF
jgi:hypothetical protein